MDGLHEAGWLIWLGIALAAGVVEVLTLAFVFCMFAGGALLAALAAAFGAGTVVQVLVFAVGSALLLWLARPPLRRWARSGSPASTGTTALVGRDARVLERVSEVGGRVKLAGEVWTARTPPGGEVLEVGSPVLVIRIDGATAVVVADGRLQEQAPAPDPELDRPDPGAPGRPEAPEGNDPV